MKPKLLILTLTLAALTLALYLWAAGKSSPKHLGAPALQLTQEILTHGPRPPASPALTAVKNLLATQLHTAGWHTTLQEFERTTPIGLVKFSNLRARIPLPGQPTWDRPIKGILCAHIDSKYFPQKKFLGADDAASACAALITIATHLSTHLPEQAHQLEIVLFDGEEAFQENMTLLDGLYGSRHYANTLRTSPDKPKFGILLDMVGHKNLSIAIPSDSPEKLAQLMFAAAAKIGASSRFRTAPGPILDDHLPLNLIGIPTIDIIGDFANSPWWHTPGDNSTLISADSLDTSIRVTLHMLGELLGK